MEFLLYPCLQMIWCFNNERRAYHSFSSFFFLKTYLTDRNLGLTVTSSAQKVSSFAFLLRSFPLASTFCSRYVGSIYGWKTFTWKWLMKFAANAYFNLCIHLNTSYDWYKIYDHPNFLYSNQAISISFQFYLHFWNKL